MGYMIPRNIQKSQVQKCFLSLLWSCTYQSSVEMAEYNVKRKLPNMHVHTSIDPVSTVGNCL